MPPASSSTGLSEPFRVRRILAEEWRQLRATRLRALAADPPAFGSTLKKEEGFPEHLWRNRALRGAEAPDNVTLIAEAAEGGWIGMAIFSIADGVRSVFGMWVDPTARRRGVGGRLLDRGLAWEGLGSPSAPARLEVNPAQVEAVALYRSRGFEFTGASRPLEHLPGQSVHEMVRRPG